MRSPRILVVLTTVVLGTALGIIGLAFHLPRSLCVSLGVTLLVTSGVCWMRPPRESISVLPFHTFCVWAVTASALFAGVYKVDHAGWLWYRLTGYDVSPAQHAYVPTSVSEIADRHAMFSVDPEDPSCLVANKGDYNVDETIVLPPHTTLRIEPGTTMRFGPGCSLISHGPIVARGTKDEPVVFRAKNRWLKWGVVGVVSAGKSEFEHACFRDGRRAFVNDVAFPGCLSLIDCDADIKYCEFHDLFGKDALYLRGGGIVLRQSIFSNVHKDGVDLDSGRGEISHNKFINCRDEGIDLSGPDLVDVFHNTVLDAKGGRIAAEFGLDEMTSLNLLGYSNNETTVYSDSDCRMCQNGYE